MLPPSHNWQCLKVLHHKSAVIHDYEVVTYSYQKSMVCTKQLSCQMIEVKLDPFIKQSCKSQPGKEYTPSIYTIRKLRGAVVCQVLNVIFNKA